MSNYLQENAAMGLPGLAPYPDVFAAFLIMLLSGNFALPYYTAKQTNKQTKIKLGQNNSAENMAKC